MEFQIAKPNKYVNSIFFASENPEKDLITRNDKFFIVGAETQEEADALIAAHNPPAPQEPTVEEKLASVGLNLNDLKTALGLA
jgi:hypothetical protein